MADDGDEASEPTYTEADVVRLTAEIHELSKKVELAGEKSQIFVDKMNVYTERMCSKFSQEFGLDCCASQPIVSHPNPCYLSKLHHALFETPFKGFLVRC